MAKKHTDVHLFRCLAWVQRVSVVLAAPTGGPLLLLLEPALHKLLVSYP